MKLRKLYDIAIAAAIDADPRSNEEIKKTLKRIEERHQKLEGREKDHADHEATKNPYLDSRILFGTGEEEIHSLIIGIDIETPELLLVHELRRKGKKIDAVMCHHPEGRALADLEKVMPVQIDVLAQCGISVTRAEGMLRPRMDRVWRSIHADNLFRTERAAELLNIPLFGCHTVSDNLVWQFMEKEICRQKLGTVGEVMDAILEIPEFAEYARKGNPPIIVSGNKENRPGKVSATEFTGGTNGPEELMKLQAEAGVGTILSMHVTEKTLEKAKEKHVNMIQCSHMASDTIGMNLLLDLLCKEEKLQTIDVAGFIRIKRK
jgi:hypothetical protein